MNEPLLQKTFWKVASLSKLKEFVPPTEYPTGVCVRGSSGEYYYINGRYRHPISSQRVLDSWDFPRVIESNEQALGKYQKTARLGFRDGTLIHDMGTGKLYFISQRLRRQIRNPEYLAGLRLNVKDAILVSADEANLHRDGEPLS